MNSIFGLDRPSNIGDGFSVLTTVYSNEELMVIRSILESAEIPFLAKARGAGGAVNVIMGFSIYGTDIFVRDEDLETASQILNADPADSCETDGPKEEI